jgi:CheY-like chemotaxis protein
MALSLSSKHSNVSILLVEDEYAHAFLIQSSLTLERFSNFFGKIFHAPSMAEAEAYLQNNKPFLILSDLNLGDARGVETVKRLHAKCPEVPIVVLTASTSLHDAVEAMRAGAEDFVVKTFDENFSDVLCFSVQRSLERACERVQSAQLEAEKKLLRSAIEYGHDGLAVIDCNGRCRYQNSSFTTFALRCGFNLDNLLESENLVVKNGVQVIAQLREGLKRSSRESVSNFEIEPLDGEDEAFMLSVSTPPDIKIENDIKDKVPLDNTMRVVWVRDISDIKRREGFQRDTLSATTHDLKGPLGAISLSVELLAKIKDPQKQ